MLKKEPLIKLIVAGSRTINDYALVSEAIYSGLAYLGYLLEALDVSELISGAARGVDQLGERWAKDNQVDIKRMPAEWQRYGKSAGYRRNEEMAIYANADGRGVLIAIWDGQSRGTKHMIDLAKKHGLLTLVWRTDRMQDNSKDSHIQIVARSGELVYDGSLGGKLENGQSNLNLGFQ